MKKQNIEAFLITNPGIKPFPLSQELGISLAEARAALKGSEVRRSKAPLHSHTVHEKAIRHPMAPIFIRVMASVIGIACLVRGFWLIVDFNGSIDWKSYLMPLIFQGLSILLPLLAFQEWKNNKMVAIGLILLSCFSFFYEFQVAMDGFLNLHPQTNAVSLLEQRASIFQSQIKANEVQLENYQILLSKRQKEFEGLSLGQDGYQTTQWRVNQLLSDIDRVSRGTEEKRMLLLALQSSIKPEEKRKSVAGLLGVDAGFLTAMQCLLLIFSTPLCFGLAIFGIKGV